MKNINLESLSQNGLTALTAVHTSKQNNKILQTEFEELERERDFLRFVLSDVTSQDLTDQISTQKTAKKLEHYNHYANVIDNHLSFELVDVEAAIVNICQNLKDELLSSNIEVFFDKLPRILGDENRISALLTNLCQFAILEAQTTKCINVDFETSQSGNRLLFEIELHKSDLIQKDTNIEASTFLLLAKELAVSLGVKLSTHIQRSRIVIELLLS